MDLKLLVDGAEFAAQLAADVGAARKSVLVQTLSFEGDGAGWALAGPLLASSAPDRRVLVDSFSRHVLSDRLRWSPSGLLDAGLRAEGRETARMIAQLHAGGVPVRYTNPLGLLGSRLHDRNHKKAVVVDERIAYLGGINFSDHNFQWHDLMLRIEDPAAAAFLHQDFLWSWQGRHRCSLGEFPGLTVHVTDGRSNEPGFAAALALIDAARESVFLECPYVTSPFSERLQRARQRGVRVTVVVPERNNRPVLRDSMAWYAQQWGLDVRFYPGRMTHMKALLVDDRQLLLGSANFDVISYSFQQEYLAVVSHPALVEEFRRRVVEVDLRQARPCTERIAPLRGRILELKLRAFLRLCGLWKAALAEGGAAAAPAAAEVRPAAAPLAGSLRDPGAGS